MRDFIFDNFEEEEKDSLLNNNNNNNKSESVIEPVVKPTDENKVFPSITLDKLTDEQTDKLFTILGNGLNKILKDLNFDDDYLPF